MGLSHGIGVCVALTEVCFESLLGGVGEGGTLGCEQGGGLSDVLYGPPESKNVFTDKGGGGGSGRGWFLR